MTGRYLTDLADVLRRAGLVVVELDGWKTRARSSGGYADGGPWCVMLHHTASAGDGPSDADYCTFRSSDRPLANLVLGRDGRWFVCAAGATNTNGKGGPYRLADGRTVAQDQMNLRAIGVEMSNNGVGMTYPAAQVDAMFAGVAALTGAYLTRPDLVAGHVDWAPGRKIDPATGAGVDAACGWRPSTINASGSWRLADVIDELARRAAPTPEVPEMTPDQAAQLDRVEQAVNACFTLIQELHPKVDARSLEQSVQDTFTTTQALHPKVDQLQLDVDALG